MAVTYTPSDPPTAGEKYVHASLANVSALEGTSSSDIEILSSAHDIQRVMMPAGGSYGSKGYVNCTSGWADASGAMEALREHVLVLGLAHGGFHWINGTVSTLTFSSPQQVARVTGARLASGHQLTADLTVLAAGAWSGKLLDLRGRVQATAQTMAYVQLEPQKVREWARTPVLIHYTSGFFMIPPTPDGILKIGCHAHGWLNEIQIPHPEPLAMQAADESGHDSRMEPFIHTSLPATDFVTLPPSSIDPLRNFLAACVPSLAPRLTRSTLFTATRVCWYADTPTGDFLVDFAPRYGRSLLVATGGSGHAFKFLPVLGEKIVERMTREKGAEEEKNKGAYEELWRWREELDEMGGDESRCGEKGLKWGDEKWN